MPSDSERSDVSAKEADKRAAAALRRILATPPDHKRKPKADASPKKRGRAAKKEASRNEGDSC
jgi:hypothetical protein